MARRASFKQSDAKRALKAAQQADMNVTGYRIEPDGAIVVMIGDVSSNTKANPLDALLR
ncbi:MAG: hypothetical protein KA533_08960 [Sphingobium sp.]|nr:hypothetical protein [Sphingobium sp.]MBP9158422.1 hypothetical protein [Sphingobium sp.]